MAHEHSCKSSRPSFEERVLNLRTDSYELIENVSREEDIEVILKRTDLVTNNNELGLPSEERTVEAMKYSSGTVKTRSIDKTRKSMEKDGTSHKGAAMVIVEDKHAEIESLHKEQPNKRGRRRPSKGGIPESIVDEEAVKERNIRKKCTRRQSLIEKRRRTMDNTTLLKGVEQGNNESSVAANTRLRIRHADDGKLNEKKPAVETETSEALKFVSNSSCTGTGVENETQLNEEENQEDIFVQFASQNVDSNVNVEGQAVKLLGPAPVKLPFEKSSFLWEVIESSDIFLSMPQQPHFIPLKQYIESHREGMTIGLMVTFSNVVSKILTFCISDPDKTIEETMDTLVDMDRHGFNLYNLRNMLECLQRLKEDHKRTMSELRSMNDLKSDMQLKEGLLNEKLEKIRESMMDLELKEKSLCEDKSSMLEQLEAFGCEISRLQNDKEAIEKSFQAAKSSLDCVGGSIG